MKTTAKRFAIVVVLAGLVSCGGGGGSSPEPTPPVSVPLYQALVNSANTGYQRTLSFTGYVSDGAQTINITGNALVSSSPYSTPAVFNGQPALRNTTTITGTFIGTLDGQSVSIPFADSVEGYISTNYEMLGSQSPTSYCVVTSYTQLPTAASVGTTGTLAKGTCFTDSTRTSPLGSQTVSYNVTAGTTSSNLTYTQISVIVDNNNVKVASEQDAFLVDTFGNITLRSVTIAGVADGLTVSLIGE